MMAQQFRLIILVAAVAASAVMVQPARAAAAASPDPAAYLAQAQAATQGDAFNQAVEAFVVNLQRQVPASSWSGSMAVGPYAVTFEGSKDNPLLWPSNFFDALIPASSVAQKELRSRVLVQGAGVPFVGYRAATAERAAAEPFSARGQTLAPVTVTITFEGYDKDGRQRVLVGLWNPFDCAGNIAADLSAPIELMLQQAPEPKLALLGFFKPGHYDAFEGLYMPIPYQTGKIPVVMVHGLDSLPRTWQDTYNELIADPVIRTRYQFWFFRYATGQPVAISAMELRNSIQAARSHVDPKHKDGALDEMVLVGHSMGGLLSRMMVTESGDMLWRNISSVPLEDANLPDVDKAYLQNMMFVHPQPYIKRVVFISTPHRGSTLASGSVGQLANKIVRAPVEVIGVASRAAMALPPGVSGGFADLVKDMPTSIDNLSPTNPFLCALQRQPIYAPHHSIIGTQGVTKRGLPVTDGIVPYWSSHLDTAESEVWVNSDHSAHKHPTAVRELDRILRLHLGFTG